MFIKFKIYNLNGYASMPCLVRNKAPRKNSPNDFENMIMILESPPGFKDFHQQHHI